MGMFDNIKCELPLPLNKKEQKIFSNVDWNDRVFQTKDTDCTLSTYSIRKNGKLYGLFIEGESVRVISEKEENKIKKQKLKKKQNSINVGGNYPNYRLYLTLN
jgi:hypothetical protein